MQRPPRLIEKERIESIKRLEKSIDGIKESFSGEFLESEIEKRQKDIRKLKALGGNMQLQPGDEITGFEIIASLPLERQLSTTAMPLGITQRFVELRWQGCLNDAAYIKALCSLYTWNGQKPVLKEDE